MNKIISNKIKYMYLFLTIGMVMYHSRWTDNYYIKPLNTLDRLSLSLYFRIAEHIGTVCMVFFFFMSAFWFYKGLDTNREVLIKWRKKIKTLLIPFIIWTIIIAIYKVTNSEIVLKKSNLFYYFFSSPVAGPLWYILGLLILQLFAPLVVPLKKRKRIINLLFLTIIVYITLRSIRVIPTFLSFKSWWWYNNLISYTPIYLIGAYIGMYYPDILLKKEYNQRKYTYIGLILLIISFILLYLTKKDIPILEILYSFIDLIGIWLIFKPKFFRKRIPDFFNCNFYIYALHNPILIPKTREIINTLLYNETLWAIEVVLIKIIQILIIVFISAIIRKLCSKIFSKEINYYLTGGR